MCKDVTKYKYTWPGQNECYICNKYVLKLITVANALGFNLQVIPLPKLIHKNNFVIMKDKK